MALLETVTDRLDSMLPLLRARWGIALKESADAWLKEAASRGHSSVVCACCDLALELVKDCEMKSCCVCPLRAGAITEGSMHCCNGRWRAYMENVTARNARYIAEYIMKIHKRLATRE